MHFPSRSVVACTGCSIFFGVVKVLWNYTTVQVSQLVPRRGRRGHGPTTGTVHSVGSMVCGRLFPSIETAPRCASSRSIVRVDAVRVVLLGHTLVGVFGHYGSMGLWCYGARGLWALYSAVDYHELQSV
ncbi:hypothetical protein OBBRIDRAFT_797041, partial [Obba rivulosa]